MFEVLNPVLYPIASIITIIFPLGELFQKVCHWVVYDMKICTVYKVQRYGPVYGAPSVLLFILWYKYIILHKSLEVVLVQKYFLPHFLI